MALDHLGTSSTSWLVSDLERSRAEDLLKDAYCAGRLNEYELDERLGRALTARTRAELNVSVAGLPPRAVMRPVMAATPQSPHATVAGGVAHLSGLVTWVFGPLVVYALSTPGTPARREAAQAFNFQALTAAVAIVVGVVGGVLLPEAVGVLMAVGWLGWLLLTITGGARALAGTPWTNPALRVLPLKLLDQSGR